MQKLPDFAYQLQGDQAEDNFIRIGTVDKGNETKTILSGLMKNFFTTNPVYQEMKNILAQEGVAIGADDFNTSRLSALKGNDNGGAYIAGTGCIVLDKDMVNTQSIAHVEKLISLLGFFAHEMTHAVHDCQGLVSVTPADMNKKDYVQNHMATEAAAYANTILAHWNLSYDEPLAEQIPALKSLWPSIERYDVNTMNAAGKSFHDARLAFGAAAKNTTPADLGAAWKAAFISFFAEGDYLPLAYLDHMAGNYESAKGRLSEEFMQAQKISFDEKRLAAFMRVPGLKVKTDPAELSNILKRHRDLLSRAPYQKHFSFSGPFSAI